MKTIKKDKVSALLVAALIVSVQAFGVPLPPESLSVPHVSGAVRAELSEKPQTHIFDPSRLSVSTKVGANTFIFQEGDLFVQADGDSVPRLLDSLLSQGAMTQMRSYAPPYFIWRNELYLMTGDEYEPINFIPTDPPESLGRMGEMNLQQVTEEGLLLWRDQYHHSFLAQIDRSGKGQPSVRFPRDSRSSSFVSATAIRGSLFSLQKGGVVVEDYAGKAPGAVRTAVVAGAGFVRDDGTIVSLSEQLLDLAGDREVLAISSADLLLVAGSPSRVFAFDRESERLIEVEGLARDTLGGFRESSDPAKVFRLEDRMILSGSGNLGVGELRSVVRVGSGSRVRYVALETTLKDRLIEDVFSVAGHHYAIPQADAEDWRQIFEVGNSRALGLVTRESGHISMRAFRASLPGSGGWQSRFVSLLGHAFFPSSKSFYHRSYRPRNGTPSGRCGWMFESG